MVHKLGDVEETNVFGWKVHEIGYTKFWSLDRLLSQLEVYLISRLSAVMLTSIAGQLECS
jgi:hypothetical protein